MNNATDRAPMTSSPNVVTAAICRMLDLLAASAQLYIENEQVRHKWGQHIRDDAGDNLKQFGLHGTSQAIIGFATGLPYAGTQSRHRRFLDGGLNWLVSCLESKVGSSDFAKTVKVAELVSAISMATTDVTVVERSLQLLLAGRDPESGAWGFDLSSKEKARVSIVPTLFSTHALIRASTRLVQNQAEIRTGLQFCFQQLDTIDDVDKNRACLCTLAYCIAEYEKAFGAESEFRAPIIQALKDSDSTLRPLTDTVMFQYRVKLKEGSEDPAFCTIQSGLTRLWVELWARGHGVELDPQWSRFKSSIENLFHAIHSAVPFPLVESCSLTVRVLANMGSEILQRLQTSTGALVSAPPTRSTPPAPARVVVPPDPFINASERERLYLKLLTAENVKEVRILIPLTGGLSPAHVDLCEMHIKDGSMWVLQVMKLGPADEIKKEDEGAAVAKDLVPAHYRVESAKSYLPPGEPYGVLRSHYAHADLGRAKIMPFLQFIEHAADVSEIVKAVEDLFQTGLRQLFQNPKAQHDSLESLRQFFEDRRRHAYWSSVLEGLDALRSSNFVEIPTERPDRMFLKFPFAIVPNLLMDSVATRKLWKEPFPGSLGLHAHGDLNPRNILMVEKADGRFTPVLIDFHRFGGPAPLALDFARLEVGIQIKGLAKEISDVTEPEKFDFLMRYEEMVNCPNCMDLSSHLGPTSAANLPAQLMKTARIVAALRSSFAKYMPSALQDPKFYFGVLMLYYISYLRPFYFSILSPEQRSFSLYSAAKIYERHFLHASR